MPHEIIKRLEGGVQEMFEGESSGHDIYHLKRTLNNALTIQEKEGGDKTIIAVSAFLHDIHRILQKQSGEFCSPKDSLPTVENLLEKAIELSNEQKQRILHCIEYHEEYDFSEQGKTAQDLETLIVQDADNLDAMGAIGIGRTFTFGGAYKLPMRLPEQNNQRSHFDESEQDPSTIHHFYTKLLKLKDNMNTETGKALAQARHDFMLLFLNQFLAERDGEK